MKVRSKKTGEIGWLYCDHISSPKKMTVFSEDRNLSAKHWDYNSLAELNEEWEDYEEPKNGWYIDLSCNDVKIYEDLCLPKEKVKNLKQIGNYFDTEEEAEKAVEKLKAAKRLKDKVFRLNHWKEAKLRPNMSCVVITGNIKVDEETKADLDLLFGGEE